jgi:hypothetical protein
MLPNMLLEAIKFGNQKFVSTFNLQANITFHHVHFPICSKHIFRPWKLCCPNILKISVSFPFPHPFFFMGLMLSTSPHFIATFYAPTSTSSVVHLDALQTTTTSPPSLEEPTLMTLGMLIENKNLYLNPFGSYKGAIM